MKKSLVKFGLLSVAAAVLVLGLSPMFVREAQARPGYMKQFTAKYPNVTDAATAKCNVCHFGDEKKNRNDYGKCFGAALPGANCKDNAKVDEALLKAESGKSADGKTFGELLKAGDTVLRCRMAH